MNRRPACEEALGNLDDWPEDQPVPSDFTEVIEKEPEVSLPSLNTVLGWLLGALVWVALLGFGVALVRLAWGLAF